MYNTTLPCPDCGSMPEATVEYHGFSRAYIDTNAPWGEKEQESTPTPWDYTGETELDDVWDSQGSIMYKNNHVMCCACGCMYVSLLNGPVRVRVQVTYTVLLMDSRL